MLGWGGQSGMGVPGDGVGRGGLGVPGMGWDRVKCGCLG